VSSARLVVLCLTFAVAPTAFAQITAATISGTSKDQTGAALPGVDVVVKNPETGLARSALTDAGIGLYHDTDGPFNSAFLVATLSPPFAATATIINPTFPRPASLTADRPSAWTIDYNIKQPYGLTFNVSVQRQLAGSMTTTVGYAGSRSYNLVSTIQGNPFVPQIQADGTKFFPVRALRRNPAFGPIDYVTNGGHSEYNSLLLSVQKRFSRRHQFQVSYTFGKAVDHQQAQLVMDVNNSSCIRSIRTTAKATGRERTSSRKEASNQFC
jgi:hypothetical protein